MGGFQKSSKGWKMAPLGCAWLAALLCFPKHCSITDLLCAMGCDNWFLFEGYKLLIWLVVYQAAEMLKSVLISSPTHQFSLMGSDVSYRYSISLLEFPSLKKIASCFHVVLIWRVQHPTDSCHFTLSPDADSNSRQLWKNICASARLPHGPL